MVRLPTPPMPAVPSVLARPGLGVALASWCWSGAATSPGTVCRNLTEAPLDALDDKEESVRNTRLAAAAWAEFHGAQPEHSYSVHYADGFQYGFADYLYAGGSGNPPVTPPWNYRRTEYETPQGRQATDDWFAGFRQGATAAQASGYRELVVVHVTPHGPVGMPPGTGEEDLRNPGRREAGPASGPLLPPPREIPHAGPPGGLLPDGPAAVPGKESDPERE